MIFPFALVSLAFFSPSVLAISGKNFKLMPLGASITFGSGSSRGNGYREDLYNLLVRDGNKVDMVGSRKGGTFKEPDVEGWPGAKITQVAAKAREALPKYQPNVVTVLVGTNHMYKDETAKNAPEELGKLIDQILARPEQTAVIVSTLPPLANKEGNGRVVVYNQKMRDVVKARADKGKWVLLVDSYKALTVKDLGKDGIHPGDAGYEKIGHVFHQGVCEAGRKGWLPGSKTNNSKSASSSGSKPSATAKPKPKQQNDD